MAMKLQSVVERMNSLAWGQELRMCKTIMDEMII
jgi:hypothetical protein